MNHLQPALTPEEWQQYAPLNRTLTGYAAAVVAENPQGAAALALHGQPFGFTWDDYYELIDNAHEIEHDYGPPEHLLPERKHQVAMLRSLARRIAALLPPQDAQQSGAGT